MYTNLNENTIAMGMAPAIGDIIMKFTHMESLKRTGEILGVPTLMYAYNKIDKRNKNILIVSGAIGLTIYVGYQLYSRFYTNTTNNLDINTNIKLDEVDKDIIENFTSERIVEGENIYYQTVDGFIQWGNYINNLLISRKIILSKTRSVFYTKDKKWDKFPVSGMAFMLNDYIKCIFSDIKQDNTLQISLIFDKKDTKHFDALNVEVRKLYADEISAINMQNNFYFYNIGTDWRRLKYTTNANMDDLYFHDKEKFLMAYNRFMKNEQKIPGAHTFSCLLYNKPGTGKTTLIKSLINYDLERFGIRSHIKFINFNDISNFKMLRELLIAKDYEQDEIDRAMPTMNQQIIVFEDFDNSELARCLLPRKYTDEEKEEQRQPIMKLGDILGLLDGMYERTGQRIFWTTNCPPEKINEMFDPAFLRPGRIDMKINFRECDIKGIRYLLNRYFPNNDLIIPNVLDSKLTLADVNSIVRYSTKDTIIQNMIDYQK